MITPRYRPVWRVTLHGWRYLLRCARYYQHRNAASYASRRGHPGADSS